MIEKIFIIIGVVALVLITTLIMGDRMMKSEFDKDVEKLFADSENISGKVYTSNHIKDLPIPVERYFKYSLKENQPYVSYARLQHGGEFKASNKWVSIKGEEYFTLQKPGFVWSGKVPFFSAKDVYIDGTGNLKVKLLSLIKIVDSKGRETDQSELLRWLGEAPLFPTALLPSENLQWEPIDNDSAKVIFTDKNLTIEGVFCFNEEGQITQFKTKRYKDNTLENFTGYCSDYRAVDGMKVPFYLEATWNLESGDLSYAKFKIDKIEYNNPTKF
ncbi:MAG: hypothetical protein HF974_09590 [ANME-2 cluster archaeon]|nr:hypothetical protein [ANME-2 cluster archaeon]